MALKAQLQSCATAYIQKYPKAYDQILESFATLNIADEHNGEIVAFLNDPALARQIAELAMEICDFLEEEQAVAKAVKVAREQLQQARAEVEA